MTDSVNLPSSVIALPSRVADRRMSSPTEVYQSLNIWSCCVMGYKGWMVAFALEGGVG